MPFHRQQCSNGDTRQTCGWSLLVRCHLQAFGGSGMTPQVSFGVGPDSGLCLLPAGVHFCLAHLPACMITACRSERAAGSTDGWQPAAAAASEVNRRYWISFGLATSAGSSSRGTHTVSSSNGRGGAGQQRQINDLESRMAGRRKLYIPSYIHVWLYLFFYTYAQTVDGGELGMCVL